MQVRLGQHRFALSHLIAGLFRGARGIVAAPDDFQAETVRRISEACGGTPDLHILNMNDPEWEDRVFDLTDGVGPDKIADFTSEQEMLYTELDLVRDESVLYIQENHRNPDRVLHVAPFAAIAEKKLKIKAPLTLKESTGQASSVRYVTRRYSVCRTW